MKKEEDEERKKGADIYIFFLNIWKHEIIYNQNNFFFNVNSNKNETK